MLAGRGSEWGVASQLSLRWVLPNGYHRIVRLYSALRVIGPS